jgi:hypothetical protein
MVHQLGSGLIVITAVEAVACAVFYGTCFRWWTSGEGRHLFSFMAVIAGALVLWTALLIADGTAWKQTSEGPREWARAATFLPIAWVIGWRFLLIVKAKRLERRRRKAAT